MAEAEWREGLAAMMRQRHEACRVEYFWYRCATGRVIYLADRPAPGRKPPSVWRPVSREASIERLRSTDLWVPGHEDHGFSTGWKPPKITGAEGTHELISLHDLNDEQVRRVLEIFHEEAERLYGVRLDTGEIPEERRGDLVQLLEGIVNKVRNDGP